MACTTCTKVKDLYRCAEIRLVELQAGSYIVSLYNATTGLTRYETRTLESQGWIEINSEILSPNHSYEVQVLTSNMVGVELLEDVTCVRFIARNAKGDVPTPQTIKLT
jgi:hypothetical protein